MAPRHRRPAYLRLGQVLRERLGVRCVLALTATATIATLTSVVNSFQIPPKGNE
jgi:ATP-dependent DNA helicase Q4